MLVNAVQDNGHKDGVFGYNGSPPLRALQPPQLPAKARKVYSSLRWLMALVEDVVKLEEGVWVEEPTVLEAAAMWEKVEAQFERGGVREGQLAWTTLVNYWRPRRGQLVPASGASGAEESKEAEPPQPQRLRKRSRPSATS